MTTKRLSWIVLVIGWILFGVLLFAAGAQEEETAVQVIKIGAIYPLTGSAAREGQESKAVLDLALEVINNPSLYPKRLLRFRTPMDSRISSTAPEKPRTMFLYLERSPPNS